jgi:hypothetical protein
MSHQISSIQFIELINRSINSIESGAHLRDNEYLEIARLWNTVSYDPDLLANLAVAQFFELFRDRVMPQLAKVWKMSASRGMSLKATEPDIEIGGILAERYRFIIGDGHG